MRELSDIVAELEATLGAREGEATALQGGITNRNFRVALGGVDYVIRLHGRDTELLGIDRQSERIATQAAAALGLAPPIASAGEDYLVTRYIPCSALREEEVREEAEQLGAALRRFHDSAVQLPSRFSVPLLLERYAELARRRGGVLPEPFLQAQALTARIHAALGAPEQRPCHNDLLPGNIIRARERGRLMIVDWEYAGMGDPRFDLGNLAVNNGLDPEREERLLSGYLGRPPRERERAALSLMRLASDAREAAWGVMQGVLSDLDFDFESYAREHFVRLLQAASEPDFEERLALLAG